MALIDDAFSGWGGILMGIGAAIIGPAVLPAVGTAIRPVAKGLVKGGLFLADQAMIIGTQVSSLAAEAREQVNDLVAEATADVKVPVKRGARA